MKKQNYYSPSEYEKYRNASKALNGDKHNQNEAYSVHNDEYYYRQLEGENNRHTRQNSTKPTTPKPPVNVKPAENKSKHYSVYDEIAEKRRKQKQNEAFQSKGVMLLKPLTPINPSNNMSSNSFEQGNTERKILSNTPITEEETEKFISKVAKISDFDEVEDEEEYFTRQDIEEICEYYRKKYSKKMWITLICSLIFFCIIFGGMYLYLCGYLDTLIGLI